MAEVSSLRPPVRQSVLVRGSRARGYLNGSYDQGWALILGRLAPAAEDPA